MATCKMVIIEDCDMKYWWECSECKTQHKNTRKFEKSRECPKCGAVIEKWIDMDDEEYE
jgi:PHP family Zn ribbon phosphoesterase